MLSVHIAGTGEHRLVDGPDVEDADIVHYRFPRSKPQWTYGPRLWKAASADDKPLAQLSRFFRYLSGHYDLNDSERERADSDDSDFLSDSDDSMTVDNPAP